MTPFPYASNSLASCASNLSFSEEYASSLLGLGEKRKEEITATPPGQEKEPGKAPSTLSGASTFTFTPAIAAQHTLSGHPTRTAEQAKGRWCGILQALGIDARFLCNKHGPCPVCGGKDRYRFDDKDGRGTWFCSHCGAGDGFQLLQQVFGWSFGKAASEVDRVAGTVQAGVIARTRTQESKLEALRYAWQASKAVTRRDPVSLYLKRRLGLDMVPADIRFHPGMVHPEGGIHPVMLAMVRYPDGSTASLHRTYLTADGCKAKVASPKLLMPGKPLQTASVHLGPVAGSSIGIAEGIETALAVSRRFHVPAQAASSAALLQSWLPPAGVAHVVIGGDNDASFTGQAAALSLAQRLTRQGYTVEVRIPDTPGADWADLANKRDT
jgi:putative DNA primase/helicase